METIYASDAYTTSETYARLDDPKEPRILAIPLGIISLLGIPGNILVIFAVCSSRKLKTSTNFLVANLAFSDLVTCLTMPIHIFTILNGRPPLDSVCVLVGGVFSISLGASILNLSLIAVNRAYLITKPRSQYDQLYSRKKIALMLIFSWVYVTLAVSVPPAFNIGALGYEPLYRVCVTVISHTMNFYYNLLKAVVVAPFIFILILCYVYIYFTVQKTTNASLHMCNQNDQLQQQMRKRQIAVTKNLFIIVCVYTICVTPYFILSVQPSTYHLRPWLVTLALFNSCVNPFIYGFNHPQFKEVFRHILLANFKNRNT
ncbi:Melatonin receptor type 1C [Holothuria leucospilota]|uniref:Melatonin receptor type 1C n=1 Tax=Holothuria leucospilota TaxID=206669 RepID=A0A9Q0YLY5_HOLLE|nr:Melatonin receptor type 1C [Holothuria leucospilota]